MVRESRQKFGRIRSRATDKRKNAGTAKRHQKEIEEQQFRQALSHFSRAAVFGELTALFAHELNQPLAAILGNAQAALRILKRHDPDLNELREIFEDIVLDDQRAAEMVRKVRSKVEMGDAKHEPLSLSDLIEEIIPLMGNDLPANTISMDLDPSLPLITGSRIQLQQVVLHLVANALEATNASERPEKLILRTRQAAGEVVLDVVDSGTGIPHSLLNSIFDPFVTTRTNALGMGLALSRSIAIRHNGRLWAENNTEGGATFHLALPIENYSNPSQTVDADRSARGLTVLIADDGDTFRHAVSSILADLPELKLIAEAADGEEALRKAAELKPDLIMLDISLPKINGVEAASRMRSVAPNAKILFLTQHESPDFVSAALKAGALGYVLKVDAGRELLQAAIKVSRGEQYISSGVRRE
jgi:nitrogen-specific signal transduction histidine kinase/CheY-like chemotaxis protein